MQYHGGVSMMCEYSLYSYSDSTGNEENVYIPFHLYCINISPHINKPQRNYNLALRVGVHKNTQNKKLMQKSMTLISNIQLMLFQTVYQGSMYAICCLIPVFIKFK